MAEDIACYRCGTSLAELSLPLSRRDLCPGCGVYVHVCRMCRHFDPNVPRQCREDDADDVKDKEALNVCDYFVPSASAFDPARKAGADAARQALDALFGEAGETPRGTDADDAEKLFK